MNNIINVHPSLVTVGEQLVSESLIVAMELIPIILIVLMAISLVRSLMGNSGIRLDFSLLFRGLLLFLVTMFFVELMDMLSYLLSVIISRFERPEDFLESLEQMARIGLLDQDGNQDAGFIGRILTGLRNLPVMIGIWIQEGLTFIIRLAVDLIRSYLLTFLYIVGPIAIAVSLIPGFRMTGLLWLKAFIGAQMWDLTLTLLDNLIYVYNVNFLGDGSGGAGAYLHALTANLVIIFLYFISPALTNYFLNAAGASQVWSKFGAMVGSAFFFGPKLVSKRGSSSNQ